MCDLIKPLMTLILLIYANFSTEIKKESAYISKISVIGG
jgi:hypothetical protein